jgi:hypothetical protein
MNTLLQNALATKPVQAVNPAGYLAQEYTRWQSLLESQPVMVRGFFEAQANSLAEALLSSAAQARFCLPDRVCTAPGEAAETPVPAGQREQAVGRFIDRLARESLTAAVRQRLDELEASTYPAVAASAGLLRYSTAIELVRHKLPAGRSVRYTAVEDEEVPTQPVEDDQRQAIDAGREPADERWGELVVPYVPAARRFFLPQWVAFDEHDRLLVRSTAEAEAHLASMQSYVKTLHLAISLASYIVTDSDYQQKRYGMLGQLINQGRALARYETGEIIAKINRRVAANDLNRGLSLSLPYFDDQSLEMVMYDFDVIPSGRIMFIPAFVVLAVHKEMAKVEQDTRLNPSTRRHLVSELQMLSAAFLSAELKESIQLMYRR